MSKASLVYGVGKVSFFNTYGQKLQVFLVKEGVKRVLS